MSNQPKYSDGEVLHTDMSGQYVAVEILTSRKGWFGWKYWCKFKWAEGGYGLKWVKEHKLFK